MSHEYIIKYFQAEAERARKAAILNEAGESLIAEGREVRTTSAILLGELMQFAASESEDGYEDWCKEVYERLLEIAEVYSRGA